MGSCIICGTTVDGEVCDVHQEDVGFVFEGTSPNELTPNRYYRGTVDGYADFGVFVDIGDSVTGLLHQSELDQRLESLSWEPGDEVFVQVTGVRDNGNVDLAWSIRQDEREFRGLLVDSPDGERRHESAEDSNAGPDAATSGGESSGNEDVRQRQSDGGKTPSPARDASSGGADGSEDDEQSSSVAEPASDTESVTDTEQSDAAVTAETTSSGGDGATATTSAATSATSATSSDASAEPESMDVGDLEDAVGEFVRLEGEVTSIHQTGGPTIIELRDGAGTVDCAAFDGAGVRAYPEVDVGDVVRIDGTVERRRGDIQVETETLETLVDDEASAITERVAAAMADAVRPDDAQFVADDDPAAPLADGIVEAATAVRQALAEERPVVLRHPATADGYAAGAAIERGAFARARTDAGGAEPDYHVVHRRPLDDPLYGMDAATSDLTRMLQDRERHGEQLPLIVLVGVGSSVEAQEAVELLDVYGVDRIVLDSAQPDEGVERVGDVVVNPHLAGVDVDLSNAALGAALGATVGPAATQDLAHVPAVGYWEDVPEAYSAAATDAGYTHEELRAIREALALEAHYQRYNDKRELVADLLFDGAIDLAEHVAGQFREKLDTEVATARDNLVVRETGGVRFAVLDTDAFTHRFDFPPTALLVDELHRRERDAAAGAVVTIGAGEDELLVRSTESVDVREIASAADDSAPAIEAVGGADGHIEYLPGDRDAAIEAVVGVLASSIEA
ncbi:nucleic acid binding OB-fold tRNA/helicase-type [Salinarchaeum sp. Harcht-Bsk1]|uniref:OB-fold nucleic acid binding domain-containing protein n=1 Tax=Salinarchaeum sp. Harcht-Bsk1 TaxID=1333523 RepID=UPI0003424156|nr:OB-fold nucleic acid binding domain-containing protein [Salinarchaeum sp. Harcht-Bsk1]AGN00238.1 nucleic acid binding OB-fold tRNA/helicase-type [Salinarchaeum sp. Harcht-Bsk1]